MDSGMDFWTAKAALDWQIEMGADEAICDAPIDRYSLTDKPKTPAPAQAATPAQAAATVAMPVAAAPEVDGARIAQEAAQAAQDLKGLHAAMLAFEHCALKSAARNLIFSDGTEGAPVMIIAEAPSRDDDRAGRLFAGPTGALLDKMLGAIGLSRGDTVYAAPVVPWNPPQNRDPDAAELAMMTPFLKRHIALADPKVVVLMGNSPCQALLGRAGMTRMRGTWAEVEGRPAVPIFGPGYLLSNPGAKRDAWADLLALKARVKTLL